MKHLFIGLSIFLLFVVLCFFLLFTNCKKNANQQTSETEISSKVNELHAMDKPGKFFPLPKNLFSADLEKLLNEAEKISDADTERIKNSDSPTDKPMHLESYIMTNVMDGSTGFSIKKIAANANTAEAFAEFRYYYDDDNKSELEIKVVLINENGWKVDNIVYDREANPDLKTILQKFIKYGKEQK